MKVHGPDNKPEFKPFEPDDALQLIRAVVINTLNLPPEKVLIETRTRPRPLDNTLYVTLHWQEQESLPITNGDNEFVEDAERLRKHMRCGVRLTTRGPGAYNAAFKLSSAFHINSRQFDLWYAIGYSGVDGVVDISAEYGGHIQQRCFIDFHFYACFNAVYPTDWFEKIYTVVGDEAQCTPEEEDVICPLPL